MRPVDDSIRALLQRSDTVSASEVARAARVSRQSAHAHLRALVARGELTREGSARATRYRRARVRAGRKLAYARDGLEEHRVWQEVRRALNDITPAAEEILGYAITELVNNAIDHSEGHIVEVELCESPDTFQVAIGDDGVGVFENVRARLGMDDHLQALQELSKGKLTTQPDRHTGEGIYFTSKAVDRFVLESSGIRWIVDNQLPDVAVMEVEPRPGTRAEVVVARMPARKLSEVFEEYTTADFEFAKSRTVVKLFTIGVTFVSRSEAKRLVHGLDKFREVVLDFTQVEGIGQGFADEVFRVWANAHPETKLTPINMGRTVEFMVRRAHS